MGEQARQNLLQTGGWAEPIFVRFRVGSPTSKLEEFPLIQLKPKVRSFPAGSNSRKKY